MDNKLKDLSKEELNSLEVEELELPVIVIDDHSSVVDVQEACDKLLEDNNKVLGFDTETKPCFKKGQHHEVALLQLSSKNIVVLFRLIKILDLSILEPVYKILKSKRILKAGLAIGDDAKGLYNSYKIVTNKTLDLRSAAKASGIGAMSLSKIYALLFGKRISKSQQLSDWERDVLGEAQVKYAALDAYAGLRIYLELKKNINSNMIQHFQIPNPPKKKSKRARNKIIQNPLTSTTYAEECHPKERS